MDPNTENLRQPPTPVPVMDIQPPPRSPQASNDFGLEVQTAAPVKKTEAPKQKVTKPPKTSSPGVGLAILATLIITLGLAAMVVYAYLKTQA